MAPATTERTASGRRVRVFRGGHCDIRDQLGHFVTPPSQEDHPCHHLCCQGRRVHPSNLPVRLDRAYLRSLSYGDLERELNQYERYRDTHGAAEIQVAAELDRRDTMQRNAAARQQRARERRETANQEYRDEVYRQWLMAEAQTRGVMLNKAGQRAGVDERSLFTGNEARVRKYASPELIEYFEQHPRPTRASWFGSARSRREHLSARRIG
jgi:hypothetical protein